MAVDERSYEMAITTVVALRQSTANALQWLTKLDPDDAAPLVTAFQLLHDELYSTGETLDELAREEFGDKYSPPRSVLLTPEQFQTSRGTLPQPAGEPPHDD